ncbi:MAG: hypothetical protein P4L51_24550 [Puia sp.]|nr:hypothetical protein [Puia sp.]
MKRVKFPGVVDTITVDDPGLIRTLSEDSRIDRVFKHAPLWNGSFLKRLIRTLSYRGGRFPHLLPRGYAGRRSRQDELWELFSKRAAWMAGGPEELEDLSRWIKGERPLEEPGILVQQVIGLFWSDQYKATAESWEAAVTLNIAARSRNLLKMIWWKITGKVSRAKRLLGAMAGNDIVFLHGTAIALHNMVASVGKMKQMYADEALRFSIKAERAVELSLSPPPVVFRQAISAGEVSGCPFAKFSMFQFKLSDAYKLTGVKDVIFMSDSWSRCPAERWVPAVLAGIWRRACK